MIRSISHRSLLIGILLFLLILSIPSIFAYTATNYVPSYKFPRKSEGIYPNNLKPDACASLNLTLLVTGSGHISGGSGSELILGSSVNDFILGFNGNDCIVGGGGNDTINGVGGFDICIGGPGFDAFSNCEVEID